MTSNAASKTEGDIIQYLERLRAEFTTLAETVKSLASESAASAGSQVSDAADRAVRGASAAGHQMYKDAAHLSQDALNAATAATDQVETQIARYPLTAVIAALGIGFAIGVLSRRQ